MTTKQIADAVGKTDRAVRNWVSAFAEKSSAIAAKLSASSPAKPAEYTLDETCQIIAEGMGENAAGIFRANATTKQAAEKPKLPNGKQLEELRLMAEHGVIDKYHVVAILGFRSYETPVSPGAAIAILTDLRGNLSKADKAAYAARKVVEERERLKHDDDAKQSRLWN